MISAIIFDCFGVLTTDAWLPFKTKYFGENIAQFDRAGELNKQSDAGLIGYESFLDEVGKMAGMSADTVQQAISNNAPNEALFEYVRELKQTYKIGLLSNASGDWLSNLFTDKQLVLFDATALSYDTRFTKPQPEAYETIAERLGESVSNCVFIDDQERFVTGATEAGMPALWYRDMSQLKSDLAVILADPKH